MLTVLLWFGVLAGSSGGGGSPEPSELLLEDGTAMLLEDGTSFLLE